LDTPDRTPDGKSPGAQTLRQALRSPWDAVKWITFAVVVAGVGASSAFAVSTKADATSVAAHEVRIDTVERRLERIEVDAAWIKSALYALTRHAGLNVPAPPPNENDVDTRPPNSVF
jgi:hypothetical protein